MLAHPNQHSLAAAMYDAIERATQELTVEQALACFRVADVPAAECISMDDHFDDEQVRHSQLYRVEEWPDFGRVRTVRYPATFGTWGHIAADGPAPLLGEHNETSLSRSPAWGMFARHGCPTFGSMWGDGETRALSWGDPLVTGSWSPGSFALPAGTVTFLLTDVESSTKMWELESAAMADAIARHYDLLDAAITSHDGVRPLEQGEGDSVVAAFSAGVRRGARGARCAARPPPRPWPTASPLKVRMAVHTGEARLRDDRNYAGQAMIRTARLRAIAHGGQVVISSAARDLVIDHLGDDVTLVDLGVHRLKDLARPEHVWQLAHADLTAEFPPLVRSTPCRTTCR